MKADRSKENECRQNKQSKTATPTSCSKTADFRLFDGVALDCCCSEESDDAFLALKALRSRKVSTMEGVEEREGAGDGESELPRDGVRDGDAEEGRSTSEESANLKQNTDRGDCRNQNRAGNKEKEYMASAAEFESDLKKMMLSMSCKSQSKKQKRTASFLRSGIRRDPFLAYQTALILVFAANPRC